MIKDDGVVLARQESKSKAWRDLNNETIEVYTIGKRNKKTK